MLRLKTAVLIKMTIKKILLVKKSNYKLKYTLYNRVICLYVNACNSERF